VQHGYHALALDEYRRPYRSDLWADFVPPRAADAGVDAGKGPGLRPDVAPQKYPRLCSPIATPGIENTAPTPE
jgi:hypothetical protein